MDVCNKSTLIESTNSLRAFNSLWRGKVPLAKRCKKSTLNPWDVLHSGDWGGGYLVVVAAVVNPWDTVFWRLWQVRRDYCGGLKSLRHTTFRWLRVVFDSWRSGLNPRCAAFWRLKRMHRNCHGGRVIFWRLRGVSNDCHGGLKSYWSFYISRGSIPPYSLF